MTPVFQGEVKNGVLHVFEKEQLAEHITSLNGKKVELTVQKRKRKRTTGKPHEPGNQNGWYWSVILPMSGKELGYDPKEMHETFSQLYAPKVKKEVGNLTVMVPIRTSNMNTEQFAEYCDTIVRTMAEMGVVIPDPEKVRV